MADARQRSILKVCLRPFFTTGADVCLIQVFRKFSYSLGPDASELLETILDQHEIPDEDVESSLETIAAEYSKQDGTRHASVYPFEMETHSLLKMLQ
jgi:hypothetical protein